MFNSDYYMSHMYLNERVTMYLHELVTMFEHAGGPPAVEGSGPSRTGHRLRSRIAAKLRRDHGDGSSPTVRPLPEHPSS